MAGKRQRWGLLSVQAKKFIYHSEIGVERCTRTSHIEEQNERDYLTGHVTAVSPDVDR